MMKESTFIAAFSLMAVMGLSSTTASSSRCPYTPGKPTIVGFSVDSSYAVGSSLSLTCKRDNKDVRRCGPYVYHWYKVSIQPGKPGDWEVVGYRITYNVYQVNAVKMDDAGIYACYVIRGLGDDERWSYQSSKIAITVKDNSGKPTIKGFSNSPYEVGSSLSLTCKTGDEAPGHYTYRWQKLSSKQPGTTHWQQLVNTSVYEISQVKRDAAGTYVCSICCSSVGSGRQWSDSSPINILVKDQDASETWTRNCSTMWTSPDPDTHIEYRNKFCVEISSQGGTRNWTLEQGNQSKRASKFDASFRSRTKTFSKVLLDKGSTQFKALKDDFTPLLQKVYNGSDRNTKNPVKDILITGFKEGSVIVHFRVVFNTSVEVTNPVANISKTLADYLEANPAEAEKYGIAPSSIISSGEFCADQPTASPRVDNSQNKAEVILAVTLTFIMLLVVAVVVLVVFLVRLKRSLHDREPRGENVAFHAESNGSGPAVKMKDRKIPEAKSNFDPYAALGDKNVYVDDDYGSLGEQKRIARPRGEKDNAAFETEDGDYLDIIGEGRMVSPSLQAELEDGYRRNEADAPVYHVLEHEPSNVTSDNRNEGAVYSLAEVTDPRLQVGGDQGVESVYALEERNGDVYAIPDKNKTGKGGAPVYSLPGRSRPKPTPGKTTSCDKETPDTKHSLAGIPGGKPQPSQSLAGKLNDDSADYSQLYGRAPGAKYPDKNKMAAKGGQGKALPSNGDGDEYSRLQIPTLTKPSTMQFLEKKPKQMKGVNSAQEDVQGDDDEDYEYSTACEVIT